MNLYFQSLITSFWFSVSLTFQYDEIVPQAETFNLLFSISIKMQISFNIRTELEITQFLYIAIVRENELKVYLGPQASGKSAVRFLQM